MKKEMAAEPALLGFSHIKRYWDTTHQIFFAKILPGEIYVTKNDEAIYTILGSCVSACIRDPSVGIGGMNHFMLPIKGCVFSESKKIANNDAARYGNWAMEYLINEILKNGGKRRNLEVKIFGGGNLNGGNPVGEQNVKFIQEYVFDESLKLLSKDVGGQHSRAVIYFPQTGKVKCRALVEEQQDIIAKENTYFNVINNKKNDSKSNDIELF